MRIRLPALAVAGLVTLTAAGALAQAEAERQLDAAIERLRTSLGPDTQLTIGNRTIDPATGRARLGDVVLTSGPRRLTIGDIGIQDLTEARLGRAELNNIVMIESKGERSEIARLVIGGLPIPAPGTMPTLATFEIGLLQAEGVRAQTPDGSLNIGRLSVEGYAPGVLGSGLAEGLEFRGAAAPGGGGPGAPSFRLGRAAVTALVLPPFNAPPDPRAFSVQSITLEGGTLNDPGRNVNIELGRVALRDWVSGRLTDLAIEGGRVSAPFGPLGQGDLRVGRIVMQGIDGAGALAAIMDKQTPPDPTVGTPQLIAIEGVTMQANSQPLFALGRLAFDGTMDANRVTTGAMTAEGLRITVPRGAAAPLEQMGYQQINGGLEMRGSYQADANRLEVSPLRISWDQAGTLSLTYTMDSLPQMQRGQQMSPEDAMGRFMNARLANMTLRYRDQGLLGRVIAQQAREQRVPEDRIREQWAQMALALPMPGSPPPRTGNQPAGKGGAAPAAAADEFTPIRQAIAQFVRQPREIEIALNPSKPMAISEMSALGAAGPAAAMRALGLTVRLP